MLARLLAGFRRNRRGAVAAQFVVMAPFFVAVVGAGVEYSLIQSVKQRVQQAADAAALAAAGYVDVGAVGPTAAYRRARALAVFEARTAGIQGFTITPSYFDREPVYEVQATGVMADGLFGTLGLEGWSFYVDAAAQRWGGPQEVAFVLDSTNSMFISGSFPGARDAIANAFASFRGLAESDDDFRATFAPFSDRMRLGDRAVAWTGLPEPADWNGCLRPRETPLPGYAYAVDDRPPSAAPFEYSTEALEPSYPGRGELPICPNQELVGPTSDLVALETALTRVSNGGTGRFDTALAWGWRAVSPRWAGVWGERERPLAYDEATKTIVYASDGLASINRDDFGEHGGGGGRNAITAEHIRHFERLCQAIVDAGINLHFLAVDTMYEPFDEGLRRCETMGARYHTIRDDATLVEALNTIVSEAGGEVRLIK